LRAVVLEKKMTLMPPSGHKAIYSNIATDDIQYHCRHYAGF